MADTPTSPEKLPQLLEDMQKNSPDLSRGFSEEGFHEALAHLQTKTINEKQRNDLKKGIDVYLKKEDGSFEAKTKLQELQRALNTPTLLQALGRSVTSAADKLPPVEAAKKLATVAAGAVAAAATHLEFSPSAAPDAKDSAPKVTPTTTPTPDATSATPTSAPEAPPGSPKSTMENLRTIGGAAVEGATKLTGMAAEQAKETGRIIADFHGKEVAGMAQEIEKKDWWAVTARGSKWAAVAALAGLGIYSVAKTWKWATEHDEKIGFLGRIGRWLGAGLYTLAIPLGIPAAVQLAQKAKQKYAETTKEALPPSPEQAKSMADAIREKFETVGDPAKDLFTSDPMLDIQANGIKVSIGNHKITVNDRPLTITAAKDMPVIRSLWKYPVPILGARKQGANLSLTFQHPTEKEEGTGKNKEIQQTFTPDQLAPMLVSLATTHTFTKKHEGNILTFSC